MEEITRVVVPRAKTVVATVEPVPPARNALNLDIANLTTDFGLKKRVDNPAWERVSPRAYPTNKHIPRQKKKKLPKK